jgi:hypothetical protein
MSDQNNSAALKPFCPVHHWRMAWDHGSSKTPAAFRCGVEKCNIRFSAAQGYFEAGKTSGDRAFLARVESVPCHLHREHHAAIVGYIKEAHGNQTDEWRQWQCFAEKCRFATKQKLSVEVFTTTQSAGRRQDEPTFATR